jgi:hypothetical protein
LPPAAGGKSNLPTAASAIKIPAQHLSVYFALWNPFQFYAIEKCRSTGAGKLTIYFFKKGFQKRIIFPIIVQNRLDNQHF